MVLEEICDLFSKVKRMNNYSPLQCSTTPTGRHEFLPEGKR